MKIESLSEWKVRRGTDRVPGSVRVCPACERETTLRPSRPRGFLERAIFTLFGRRLFRCGGCGRRVRLPKGTAEIVDLTHQRDDFLSCPDTKSFEEVIQELKEAERALETPPRRLSVVAVNGVRSANSSTQGNAVRKRDLTTGASKS